MNILKSNSIFSWVMLLSITMLTVSCGGGGGGGDTESQNACDKLVKPDGTECILVSERASVIYRPASDQPYNGIALFMHGAPGKASKVFNMFDGKMLAEEYGLVAVAPKGNGSNYEWRSENDGATEENRDIVYLNQLLDSVFSESNFKSQNVYVFGYSAGGFMAYKMACEMPERLTAIISVAGQFRGELAHCSTSTPVAVHHMHNPGDREVSYNGQANGAVISVPETIAFWQQKNGCSLEVEEQEEEGVTGTSPGTTTSKYLECSESVRVSLLNGVRHEDSYIAERLMGVFDYLF